MDTATQRRSLSKCCVRRHATGVTRHKIMDVTARWAAWAADPDHNPAPNPKARHPREGKGSSEADPLVQPWAPSFSFRTST